MATPNKDALDKRISANYIAHNYAEVMRIAYHLAANCTEEQLGFVLTATEIQMFVDNDKLVTA
jgi:hypothetical protein